MGNMKKRAQGLVEEAGGKLKRAAGRAIGNQQMEAEGAATELKGMARQEVAKAAERAKGAFEEATGTLKKHLGSAIDNQQMEAEGKARELKGQGRQAANKTS